LIAGGDCCGDAPNDVDLYDPVSISFAVSTASMITAHEYATAILLPNGTVLIAGGGVGTELYDPASNGFATATVSMNMERSSATATLLLNGKVLIAGGAFET
jgi:hypothetical protein